MIERIDLYKKVHKGQRAWLSRCLVASGRLGDADRAELEALREDVLRLLAHLRAHGEHEERFIHPLLREADAAIAERLDAEHASLDATFDRLQAALEAREPATIYGELSALIVTYFAHLNVEEREAMPAMQRYCDDRTVVERVLKPFAASRSFSEAVEDLRLQLLAVDPQESAALLAIPLPPR